MKRLDKGKEARRAARKHAQKPQATRKIEDKRRKPPKHRKPLGSHYGAIGVLGLVMDDLD